MYFHLTSKFLGKECTLKPVIPRHPLIDIELLLPMEDMTTPRISFAPTIEGAFIALGEMANEDVMLYVYRASKVAGLIDPSTAKCPSSPRNPYNAYFRLGVYAEHTGIDPYDEETRKEIFRGCVPDAKNTGEVWATKPTRVKLDEILIWDETYDALIDQGMLSGPDSESVGWASYAPPGWVELEKKQWNKVAKNSACQT